MYKAETNQTGWNCVQKYIIHRNERCSSFNSSWAYIHTISEASKPHLTHSIHWIHMALSIYVTNERGKAILTFYYSFITNIKNTFWKTTAWNVYGEKKCYSFHCVVVGFIWMLLKPMNAWCFCGCLFDCRPLPLSHSPTRWLLGSSLRTKLTAVYSVVQL